MSDDIADLTAAVERLTQLLAMAMVWDRSRGDQIAFLAAAGYQPAEIGNLLGISANQVSVTLFQAKKKPKKSPAKGRKAAGGGNGGD